MTKTLPEFVSPAVGKQATKCMEKNEGVLVLPDEVWDVMFRPFHLLMGVANDNIPRTMVAKMLVIFNRDDAV